MSKAIKIKNTTGADVGEYAIQDAWLEYEKGAQAVHDCVVAFLAGIRAGTASTKTRSEVRGGGAKPWRQKGTGRARAGSSRSPIWRGGGVTFGPKPRSFAKKVNKKVRQLALRRAFTDRFEAGAFTVLDNLPTDIVTVKAMQKVIDTIGTNDGFTMLVVPDFTVEACRACDNIPDLLLIKADSVNVYQLLRYPNIIFTKDAMDLFAERLGKGVKA